MKKRQPIKNFKEEEIFKCLKDQLTYEIHKKGITLKMLSRRTRLSLYEINQVLEGNLNSPFEHYVRVFSGIGVEMCKKSEYINWQNHFFDFSLTEKNYTNNWGIR